MAADRTVRVLLVGDASSLVEAANRGRNALHELGQVDTARVGAGVRATGAAAHESASAFDRLRSSMAAQVGIGNLAVMGLMSGIFAVKAAILDTVRAGTDYQTTLFTLGAVTHATTAEMDAAAAKARELGKDITIPGASATDAAKAMTELAKGGLSVEQAMTAAKGTLLLAAAASVTASQAAEVEVNTLNAYGLAATQAGHVSDVLANAANQASGEMMDFANGLRMVGATAHGFGISLEDTTTTLGLFANAGIKGEMGGTLLNTMLLRLAAPTAQGSEALKTLGLTVFDASGKFEGMAAVTEQLRSAHSRLTTAAYDSAAAHAFGTRGIRAAMILGAEGADAYDKMSGALTREGGAAELAGAKMAGLGGAFENFKNQVQDAQLQVFASFAPQLTTFVNNFAGAFPAMIDAAMSAIGFVANKAGEFLTPIIEGVKNLATQAAPYVLTFVDSVKEGITTALDALAPFGQKLADLFQSSGTGSGVINGLGVALTTVGHAFVGVMDAVGPLLNIAGDITGFFAGLPEPIKAVVIGLGAAVLLKGPLAGLFASVGAGFTSMVASAKIATTEVIATLSSTEAAMLTVRTSAQLMWSAIGGWVGVGLTALITAFSLFAGSLGDTKKNADSAKQGVDGLVQSLVQSKGAIDQTTVAAALAAIQQQTWGDSSKDLTSYSTNLGVSLATLVGGLTGVAGASDAVESAYQKQKTALQTVIDAGQSYSASFASQKAAIDAAATLKILDQQHDAWVNLAGGAAGAGAAAKAVMDVLAGAAPPASEALGGTAYNVQTLKDQLLATEDPAKAMNEALKDFKTQANFATTAGDFLWASLQALSGNQVDVEHRIRLTNAAMADMLTAARAVTDANTNVGNAAEKTAKAQEKYDNLAAHLGETLNGQAESATNLAVTQDQVDQASRDLTLAQSAEATAHENVTKAQDKQIDTSDQAAKKAIEQAGSTFVLTKQTGGLQAAIDAAGASMESSRQAFIANTAQINGGDIPAATALADSLHLIPGEVITTLKQEGMITAIQQADELFQKLSALDQKKFKYTVVGDQVYQYLVSNPGSASTTDYLNTGPGTGPTPKSQWTPPKNADGGLVSGPGGPRDDLVPALLSNREFVVNAAATDRHLSLLHAINAGRYAEGGPVSGPRSVGPQSVGASYTGGSYTGSPIAYTLISDFQGSMTTYPAPKIMRGSAPAAPGGGGGGAPAGYSGAGGVEQWRGLALQALAMAGQSADNVGALLYQMQTESSGNPSAINLTDINAQRGIPSKGLMQVIDPTFRSFAMPGFDSNIYDPLSNILASIRYGVAQYGSLARAYRGVAYAGGGIVPGTPSGVDNVPAWLSPGEAVISRSLGYKDKNKSYLDEAASWFGGRVVYPGAGGQGLTPQFGTPVVNVAAPNVTVYVDGNLMTADRVSVLVDGKMADVASRVNRARGQR